MPSLIFELLQRVSVTPVDLEWPRPVFVRQIPARVLFDAQAHDGDSLEQMASLVQQGACDKDGKLLFSDEDVKSLERLPMADLEAIVAAITKFNGLDEDGDGEADGEGKA